MPKKIIQDIVARKSIRTIKKSEVKENYFEEEKKVPIHKHVEELEHEATFEHPNHHESDLAQYMEKKKHVTKDSLIFLWIICIIAIATLLFLLSSTFATATLTITPKSEAIALNDTFNIFSDKNATGLHFQVMSIKKELSKTLETDGQEYVERKATGKAIIYNNYSSSKQRLINNTRLETKDGLIYRIRQSVEVPGVKTISGVKTPGSVEVEIIADAPGEKYNMNLSDLKGDFTIPGFKGDPRYTTFYGRLSADVTGGLVGNIKKVSDEKLAAGRAELNTILNSDLIKDVFAKKPEQLILFKDNYYISCKDLADNSANNEYKISVECTINAIAFDKSELSTFIATNKIKGFDNSKVDVMWNDNAVVSLMGSTENPWKETSLKARFAGAANVVWTFDADQILSSILGQDKSILSSVIENHKNSLAEVEATIRPIWRNTFPEKENKIKIVDTIRDAIK
jgi:hypothetical protein